jgi:hypothetical protein
VRGECIDAGQFTKNAMGVVAPFGKLPHAWRAITVATKVGRLSGAPTEHSS